MQIQSSTLLPFKTKMVPRWDPDSRSFNEEQIGAVVVPQSWKIILAFGIVLCMASNILGTSLNHPTTTMGTLLPVVGRLETQKDMTWGRRRREEEEIYSLYG